MAGFRHGLLWFSMIISSSEHMINPSPHFISHNTVFLRISAIIIYMSNRHAHPSLQPIITGAIYLSNVSFVSTTSVARSVICLAKINEVCFCAPFIYSWRRWKVVFLVPRNRTSLFFTQAMNIKIICFLQVCWVGGNLFFTSLRCIIHRRM